LKKAKDKLLIDQFNKVCTGCISWVCTLISNINNPAVIKSTVNVFVQIF
jgi:hypothetical protein